MSRPKALLSWSTGKDSAYTLAVLREQAEVDIVGLVSTNVGADRVAMHGVRRELLLRQAEAVGLPVHEVTIPCPCSNEEYENGDVRGGCRCTPQGPRSLSDRANACSPTAPSLPGSS